ncbi:MAG: type II toxin-antitoxin system YafQ family toxin [Pseudomonadota bacterium]|nr:type II toxin-antitoxin system YafQ family toxin [Pseudomonadota bacterium]
MASRDKAASLPRTFDVTGAFRKDWERLSRSGRHDMRRLKEAMLLLIASDGQPGPEWRDHALKGEWTGTRECHVGGDFLLICQIDDTAGASGTVVFVRAGTHSELFR